MVLIVVSLASAYFFYTLSENTNYNIAVKQQNQLVLDRLAETAQATNTMYAVGSSTVTVTTTIANSGPSPITLATLWVRANNSAFSGYNFTSINVTVRDGESSTKSFTLPITGIPGSGNSFTSWFVTSRGNTIVSEPARTENIIVAQVSQGIGNIAMNFTTFVYRTTSNIGSNNNPIYVVNNPSGPGTSGYSVPASATVAFTVTLMNFDTRGDIFLSSSSALWVLFPTTSQQPRGAWWYIVNVDANGRLQPVTPSTQIRLTFATPINVTFASSGDALNSVPGLSSAGYVGPSAANLMLFGTDAGQIFGQNIPFVSIKFTPP